MGDREIRGYHAHVYFDADTVDEARALQSRIEGRFEVRMGRFHQREVGPHPRWSYQVSFRTDQFGELVPWLALHREALTVFIHGVTGDDFFDHTVLTFWLGESVPLRLDALR